MKKLAMMAAALVLSGWAGSASAQAWYYDDDPYPRRWGYERGYDRGWDRGPRYGYERERRFDRRDGPNRRRAERGPRRPNRQAIQPNMRAGNCYTPPPRPHAAPRVICRY